MKKIELQKKLDDVISTLSEDELELVTEVAEFYKLAGVKSRGSKDNSNQTKTNQKFIER